MGWVDDFRFGEPLARELRADATAAQSLTAELRREVAVGHPLHGADWIVIAQALSQDDVVVQCGDQAAIAHLTFSGKSEEPPYPRTTVVSSAIELESVMRSRHGLSDEWARIALVPIGGVVAVGFVDSGSIAVGSHSGLGILNTLSGETVEFVGDIDGSYPWYVEDPPAIRHKAADRDHLVPACGLWGGVLSRQTSDGWVTELLPGGAVISHPDLERIVIGDAEEPRALGFSQADDVLVFATSSTVHLYRR